MKTTTCLNVVADPALDESQPGCHISPANADVLALPEAAPSCSPAFPRYPGETPRAFGAFLAFFQLGHGRSLQGVADHLGERYESVKAWSSKYHWSQRIQSFNSGILQRQADAEAAARIQQATDWSRRNSEYRELEWAAAQKLLAAAQCYLDSFGDQAVEKMTLAQVSRALEISSKMARLALNTTHVSYEPAVAPVQEELLAALQKAYASPTPPSPKSSHSVS